MRYTGVDLVIHLQGSRELQCDVQQRTRRCAGVRGPQYVRAQWAAVRPWLGVLACTLPFQAGQRGWLSMHPKPARC